MKKRRNSTASNAKPRRNGAAKVSHLQIPSFSDLPNNILVTILLRLLIKKIFVCKCVCKTWYDLISDPDFAKLHFNQAQVCPLLRTRFYTKLPCMLYLVQPEQDDFERMCDMLSDHSSPTKIKLDCKLKLPLRSIKMGNHNYEIVNSCNGLLCLSNPSDNEPVIVCNPVTGEFIYLPVRTVNKETKLPNVKCGFGFSPATNQYKVVRMFARSTRLSKYDEVIVAEVHTLGTETWRVLRSLPNSTYKLFPTYLNGCVYWFSKDYVTSFDIEKECFESISLPPLDIDDDDGDDDDDYDKLSMGVLGDELFISVNSQFRYIRFWAMKDNGGKKSWSQIFSFQRDDVEKWSYGPYQPIMYLNNGTLLMFNSWRCALIVIYKDPGKTGFRYLELDGSRSEVEAIPHIPSFVPLKHALSGHDVEVLNVKSRCAELNLHGETKYISIVEEDGNSVIDPYDMDQMFDYEDIDWESDFDAD